MTTRAEALLNGELKYWPNKPCRRGHVSERYTSNGMCVACLNGDADLARKNRIARNNERERLLCKDIVQTKMNVPYKYISNTILQTIERLLAAPNGDQFCTWLEMMDMAPLSYTQLAAMFDWRNDTVHADYNAFPQRNDDAGYLLIQIGGNWYMADHIMETLRGQRPHAARISEQP